MNPSVTEMHMSNQTRTAIYFLYSVYCLGAIVFGRWTRWRLRRLLRQPGNTTVLTPDQVIPGSHEWRLSWYIITSRFNSTNSSPNVVRASRWAFWGEVFACVGFIATVYFVFVSWYFVFLHY
jgi:hypothetical protein